MDVESIVNRALADEAFATELGRQAAEAAGAGIHSEAWREYVSQFADTPEELEELNPAGKRAGDQVDHDHHAYHSYYRRMRLHDYHDYHDRSTQAVQSQEDSIRDSWRSGLPLGCYSR